MGIIQKQGSISTLFNYAGVGIAYVNLIFILPHFLSLEQIGLLRVIIEIATLLMLVFQFGSPYLIIRFFPRYADSDRNQRSFYTLALVFSFFGILMMLLFYQTFRHSIMDYFSEKSASISDYETAFLAISGALVLFNVFERIFGSKKIVVIPTFLKELVYRAGLSVITILFGLQVLTFSQGVNLWVGFYALAPIILFLLYKKKFGLKFSFSPDVWNSRNLKSYTGYAAIVSLGAIGGGLSLKIDMLMTASMLGLKELSIYATMVYVATVIEIPKRALVQISDPFISEFYTEGRMDKIGDLYKRNSVILLVMGLLLFLGIYFNLPYLFEIMPKGESFALGMNVFIIIALVKIMSLLSGITNQILLNSVEAWVSSVTIVILAFMSIGLNFYFIPRYGLEGAALATLLSVGTNHLLTMLYVYLKFNIHPFCKEIWILFLVVALFIVLGSFIPKIPNPYVGLLVTSAAIGISYTFIIWKLNISADANKMIVQVLEKVKKRYS